MKRAIARARELRLNATDAERFLWRHLRLRQLNGYRFRRQRPVGPYILDFVCVEKRLAIEVDGGQHNQADSHDRQRDAWLQKQGFVILRFWNNEVLNQIGPVKEAIAKALAQTPFLILPRTRGRKGDRVAGANPVR
jgi:very-short-patch-repair endonuclease